MNNRVKDVLQERSQMSEVMRNVSFTLHAHFHTQSLYEHFDSWPQTNLDTHSTLQCCICPPLNTARGDSSKLLLGANTVV